MPRARSAQWIAECHAHECVVLGLLGAVERRPDQLEHHQAALVGRLRQPGAELPRHTQAVVLAAREQSPRDRGDSWDAVRQRYQQRAAGDDPTAATAARAALSAAPASAAPRRVVRNAYGDEIVVE